MDSFENQMKYAIINFTYNLVGEWKVIMAKKMYLWIIPERLKTSGSKGSKEIKSNVNLIYTMVKYQGCSNHTQIVQPCFQSARIPYCSYHIVPNFSRASTRSASTTDSQSPRTWTTGETETLWWLPPAS